MIHHKQLPFILLTSPFEQHAQIPSDAFEISETY